MEKLGPRQKLTACRWRRVLLVLGLVYSLGAFGWLALPLIPESWRGDFMGAGLLGTPLAISPFADGPTGYAVLVFLVLGLLMLAQWAFLRPGPHLAARLALTGRPLRGSILAAGFMAMLLTVGFGALLLEILDQWESPVFSEPPTRGSVSILFGVYVGMGLGWLAWTIVFYIYWRQGDRYTQLGKMIRGLVAGSLLETLVAVPVHIWAVRQRECYCDRGTYTTLVFSGTVLLWAFGPGIVLLYMRERCRQARLFPKCPDCGYDLRASREKCPECGRPVDAVS